MVLKLLQARGKKKKKTKNTQTKKPTSVMNALLDKIKSVNLEIEQWLRENKGRWKVAL